MTPPEDANDLRGFHFKRLLGKPAVEIAIGVATLAAWVAATQAAGVLIGLLGGAATLLVALAIVYALADAASEDAFFAAYARQRGLALSGKGPLPPATPLLRKGDERYGERILTGPIADGFDGIVALYTYEEESANGDGRRQTAYHRFTVAILEVPECAPHASELYCRRREGARFLDGLEDAFRRSTRRVELESEALDRRYEIFAASGDDDLWLRRLFSPTFIVWLTDSAPQEFAFELVAGALCCSVKRHKKAAAELDALRAAAGAVAARLREESAEELTTR